MVLRFALESARAPPCCGFGAQLFGGQRLGGRDAARDGAARGGAGGGDDAGDLWLRGGDGRVGVAGKVDGLQIHVMDTSKDQIRALKREIISMLMTVTDEVLLVQIKGMMLAAGVEPYEEIRTMADLEARFRNVEQDYAEGRYITHEEMLAEMESLRCGSITI